MRDAMGGTVVVVVIVVFIVMVSGYLAFNVNYTKAFRMKNKIISYYDDYNGDCDTNSVCKQKIREYAKDIGYKYSGLTCPEGYVAKENLYCSQKIIVSEKGSDTNSKTYYKIVTKINIEIPVFKFISTLRFFNVSGNTKTYIGR